jgi:probable phosphoglycerate mutase
MTPLVLIRHGPTAWNAESRLQGQSDTPLSPEGRDAVRRWRLPAELDGGDWTWLTSPLHRARETVALLRPDAMPAARPEPALMEMRWGAWEGRLLEELRAEGGAAMRDSEARGLDFRPPGGESPRDVAARMAPLLAAVAAAGSPTVAVCHKGVIRAVYATAAGWDMTGQPPEQLRDACAHRFLLDRAGAPRVARLNIPLT